MLLLVGFFALLAANAKSVSDYFKENIAISVILKGYVEEKEALELEQELLSMVPVKSVHYISKAQGTEEMKELLGANFLDIFESNPIPVSFEVQLNGDYFSPDSVALFTAAVEKMPQVDEVSYQSSLISAINDNVERIGLIFLVFVLLLLFISFVLINNTVRLNVYSKRFSIYTMRLVGATRAFIRAPFLLKAVFQGLISALLAVVMLLAMLLVVREQFAQFFSVFEPRMLAYVLSGLVVLGILICVTSTFFVVNRLVSLKNDELYY